MGTDKSDQQPDPKDPEPKNDETVLPPPPEAPTGRIVRGGVIIGDKGWKGGGGLGGGFSGGFGGKK